MTMGFDIKTKPLTPFS